MKAGDWNFLAPDSADWRAVMLFDIASRAGLVGESGNAADIAARHDLDARAVDTLLEGLEAFGLARREGDGGFAFEDVGEAGPTMRHHADVIRSWSRLSDRLANPVIDSRPERSRDDLARWLEALALRARISAPDVVATCLSAVPAARSVLDLGGGHGVYAAALAQAGLEATIQDRGGVIDIIGPRMRSSGVEPFTGDFHDVLPDGQFDIVLMSGVAHTMQPRLLENLYVRLRPIVSDALIVMTMFSGTDRRRRAFNVQMLAAGNGGGTFGEHQHREWLNAAGFDEIAVNQSSTAAADVIIAR